MNNKSAPEHLFRLYVRDADPSVRAAIAEHCQDKEIMAMLQNDEVEEVIFALMENPMIPEELYNQLREASLGQEL